MTFMTFTFIIVLLVFVEIYLAKTFLQIALNDIKATLKTLHTANTNEDAK